MGLSWDRIIVGDGLPDVPLCYEIELIQGCFYFLIRKENDHAQLILCRGVGDAAPYNGK